MWSFLTNTLNVNLTVLQNPNPMFAAYVWIKIYAIRRRWLIKQKEGNEQCDDR